METEKIFVVGSGPSLSNFDFSLLVKEQTIAVNMAVKFFEPSYFLTADSGVIEKAAKANFWGVKAKKVVIMQPAHKRYRDVKEYLQKFDEHIIPRRCDGEIGFDYENFATLYNSGGCALQYAILLGYKKIYLLGIDCTAPKGQRYFYSKPTHQRRAGYNLEVFFRYFARALTIAKTKNIDVFSCSNISLLNEFAEYVPIEEAVK